MIRIIKGFRDILPGDIETWQWVEKTAQALFESYGFKEIRIPILERTELFARSIGEDTDIVEKEMYTFADRKGELLTLRPEATASIVRSYLQHRLYDQEPVRKVFTIGPMFRRERPQKGRYRQFYQINAEVFGVASAYIDAQLIVMLSDLLQRLELKALSVHLNSLGCPECRPVYRQRLLEFLSAKMDALCDNCQRRSQRNPLRVLDCKNPKCSEIADDAPTFSEHWCPDCRSHFETVTRSLSEMQVPFVQDDSLVRGLDYYSRTTFEVQTRALGAQSAVAGGGRYDGLAQQLDGPPVPAIGFAIGFDRLVELVEQTQQKQTTGPQLFIAALGDAATQAAFPWSCELARAGITNELELGNRSLKSQMKRANRLGADHVLIVGDQELAAGQVVLRNMQTKNQVQLPLAGVVTGVIDHIRNGDAAR